jgi:excisionase family DNA binding protein
MMERGDLDQFVDKFGAAKMLGLSPRTLDTWAFKKIGIPFVRVGRLRRYPLAGIQRWLASQPRGGAEVA